MSKKDISQSKFLSLVLRHKPETIGVTLDPQGWIEVETLLEAMARHGHALTRPDLERLVSESDKQRFALSEDGKRIRTNQGHSVEVDLALTAQAPPELLYHGTVDRFLDSIRATGLDKRQRHHVHLSADVRTASKVGERRGKPVILEIDSGQMHKEGHRFFLSENGVWLVDHVPAQFITFPDAAKAGKKTLTLFRPTGLKELELIFRSGMKAFPPRLPEQPIFYPVMNREYAQQIARDWNAKSEQDRVGFVLRFNVEADCVARYPVQTAGARQHQELWVPAEELDEFNRHVVGEIEVIDAFKGETCALDLDEKLHIPKAWLQSEAKVLFQGHALTLKKKGHWEYVERTKASGIVAVVPVTEQNEVIVVEQFRIPVGRRVIEIPAGLAGDAEGEEAEELANAARRELREETGYEAQTMKLLTEGPPSAGLSTEVVTFFRAGGLKKVSDGGGDGTENIQIHLVPLARLDAWIDSKRRDGCLVDYKIYAALYFVVRPP
jgi:putative RNA 2'-phosphotransferase